MRKIPIYNLVAAGWRALFGSTRVFMGNKASVRLELVDKTLVV